MVDLGLPELSTEKIETLCETAENAARKHILSKVSSKMVEKLDISVEAEGTKPLVLTVEIDLVLSQKAADFDVDSLVKEAVNKAHEDSEKYLRKTK